MCMLRRVNKHNCITATRRMKTFAIKITNYGLCWRERGLHVCYAYTLYTSVCLIKYFTNKLARFTVWLWVGFSTHCRLFGCVLYATKYVVNNCEIYVSCNLFVRIRVFVCLFVVVVVLICDFGFLPSNQYHRQRF